MRYNVEVWHYILFAIYREIKMLLHFLKLKKKCGIKNNKLYYVSGKKSKTTCSKDKNSPLPNVVKSTFFPQWYVAQNGIRARAPSSQGC